MTLFKAKMGQKGIINATDRQTDRQTNSLTPYMVGCVFFLSVKFANSLLALLTGDKPM